MPILADRVKETSTTTGTGTLNLDGAVSNYITFVAGIGNGNKCYYAIVHRTVAEWEVGIGTVTDAATDTLSRDTIHASSNSNNGVSLSAGTKDVFVTASADALMDLLYNTYTSNTTLAINDAWMGVKMNSSSALTLTVPPNSSVAFRTGTQIVVQVIGTGTVTVTAGVGVTINGGSLVMNGQYSYGTLVKTATDTWDWSTWTLNIFQQKIAPTSNIVIQAGYGAYIPDQFETPNGVTLEVADGGIFEVG